MDTESSFIGLPVLINIKFGYHPLSDKLRAAGFIWFDQMYNIGRRKETFTVDKRGGGYGPNKFGKWIVSFRSTK